MSSTAKVILPSVTLPEIDDVVEAVHSVVIARFNDRHPHIDERSVDRQSISWTRSFKGAISPQYTLNFPVCFVFLRGDRAGSGKTTAQEMSASLRYWHLDSGRYIDFVFPGWRRLSRTEKGKQDASFETSDGGMLTFDVANFLRLREQVEQRSRWRYSGETDLLILNYAVRRHMAWGRYAHYAPRYVGSLHFGEAISWTVERMIKTGLTPSIDALMQELITASKQAESPGVWEISDRIGSQRGSKALWEFLKRKFAAGIGGLVTDLEPFRVRNLSRSR